MSSRSAGPELVLASASPRRSELLAQLQVRFRCLDPGIDERRRAGEPAARFVRRMAGEKALAGRHLAGDALPVLAADTDVVLDGDVLGKPQDFADASRMLGALSGREHEVYSAVALATRDGVECRLQVSRVTFAPLAAATIEAYWRTGEPAGKAGAYAIQGQGAAFVSHLEGSYSGVMGLPLFETALLLRGCGMDLPRAPG